MTNTLGSTVVKSVVLVIAALLLFAPFLFLGMYPISIPFTLGARALYRKVHPPQVGVGRQLDSRVEIQRLWRDITRLRGRRGLVLSLSLRAGYLQGKRLEVVARLRGPDGRYLRGQLRNYRGDLGEVRVRYTTQPIQNMVALFERIWMFVPMRALGLPPGTRGVELVAEVLVGVDGTTYAEAELPVSFRPLPEDFPHLLPEPAAGAPEGAPEEGDAVQFLGDAPAAPGASACGVCGDPLEGDVQVRCDLCDAPHHPECWEYLGGCSTYACEGRPAAG